MKRPPPSIRWRLLLVVLASVVPAAILVAVLLTLKFLEDRAQIEAMTRSTARAVALRLDQKLAGMQASLAVLATSRLIRPDQLGEFHMQAREVQLQQGFAVIGLLDRDGRPLMNTLQPLGAALRPAGAAPHVAPVFKTGKPVVTDLFRASIRGTQSVAVAVPVVQRGETIAALVGGIDPASLRALIAQQGLPSTWIAAVIDRTGTVVARSQDHDKFIGASIRDELRARMASEQEASLDGYSLEGVPLVTSFSTGPASGWRVTVGMPRAELTGELRTEIAWLAFGTTLVFASGLLLAMFVARGVSRTVGLLQAQAERLGRGEPVEIVRTGFAEAQGLASGLARASLELRHAASELAARQSDLAHTNSRLAGLLESAMDGIVSVDEDQRVVLFNLAAERMFGRRKEDVLGKDVALLMPPSARAGHAAHVEQFGNASSTTRRMGSLGIVNGLRADGTVFPIEASISQVRPEGGRLYTAVLRDVSERADFSRRASEVREEDKKRIARELHDDVIQTLAVLRMDAAWLLAQPHLDEDTKASIARMDGLLSGGVNALRRVATDLRPVALDEQGLDAALESLAQTFRVRNGIACHLRVDAGLQLDDPFATEIYRIAQEALTNVAKHARASRVEVVLARIPGGVVLTVHDDGTGFDPSQPRRESSLGLMGVRERVQLLDGAVEIESAPGRGTRIAVTVPLAFVASP